MEKDTESLNGQEMGKSDRTIKLLNDLILSEKKPKKALRSRLRGEKCEREEAAVQVQERGRR